LGTVQPDIARGELDVYTAAKQTAAARIRHGRGAQLIVLFQNLTCSSKTFVTLAASSSTDIIISRRAVARGL